MKFGNGDLAIDFEVVTPDGGRTSLSSLKGKVIYIDIWATWCGPCMAEMPYLEQMKEKYKSIPDVAIVSLSIDDRDPIWLRDLERRKAGGIQWRIDRPKLSQYEVVGIPRYILIDKNFVVAEMEAPHASNEKASILIENLLIK
jgi:thiol-disulfide isomerase/thioredoxin